MNVEDHAAISHARDWWNVWPRHAGPKWPGWLRWGGVAFVAVLFILGSPPYSRIPPRMRIKQTSVLARGLADAAERFYADHSRWPVVSKGDGNPGDLETDTSAGTEFIKVLLGCEDPRMVLNRANIDYLDGLKPAKPNPERENEWVNGLVMEGGTFALMDYWGKPFRVRLDADGDGEILKPDAVGTGKDKLKTRRRVAVWSAGPDGNFETWEDNPRSWE